MNTPTNSPIKTNPQAPKKTKKDRAFQVAEEMLSSLNELSMSISRDRRALDRAFATWISQKREFNEFIAGHKDEEFFQMLATLQDDLEEEHFAKKRKAEFIKP